MKTVRFIMLLVLGLLCQAVSAQKYVVQRGDILSTIAMKFSGVSYKDIAQANNIQPPYVIRLGQSLKIPEKESRVASPLQQLRHKVSKGDTLSAIARKYKINMVKLAADNGIRPPKYVIRKGQWLIIKSGGVVTKSRSGDFLWRHVNRDSNLCDLERSLELLGYPPVVIEALNELVESGNAVQMNVVQGDFFSRMMFGQCKFKDRVRVGFRSTSAEKYTVVVDGVEYGLVRPKACDNWSRVPDRPVYPQEELIVDLPRPIPLFDSEDESHFCDDYELNIGVWMWGNKLAKGHGVFGEAMCWKQFEDNPEYRWGLGPYGMWSPGDSKTSAYEWEEWRLGLQAGLMRHWWYENDEGREFPQQWQIKFRLVYEDMEGGNSRSGYAMHQENLLLGVYGEYWRQYADDALWGVSGEIWHPLQSSIDSTWAGDSPSDRFQAQLYAFWQKDLSEDWKFRLSAGPGYTGWDDMFWLRGIAELRWQERIMFGPTLALPLGISDAYQGLSFSDLTTYGFFIRFEFGNDIREYVHNQRAEQVRQLDREEFGVVMAGEELPVRADQVVQVNEASAETALYCHSDSDRLLGTCVERRIVAHKTKVVSWISADTSQGVAMDTEECSSYEHMMGECSIPAQKTKNVGWISADTSSGQCTGFEAISGECT